MTKPLFKWEKDQRKARRSVLLQIKKLLKDKSVRIQYHVEHKTIMGRNHEIVYTGEHEAKLEWITEVKK